MNENLEILKYLIAGYTDPDVVEQVFKILFPGKEMSDPDLVGHGNHADTLVIQTTLAFARELSNADSPHFMAKSIMHHVDRYLDHFNVVANGPDLLKFICAFGIELENYVKSVGERELVKAMIRFNTLRLLAAAATLSRADEKPPSIVMMKKLYKIQQYDDQIRLLGQYGMYMILKTWSLGSDAG